MDTAKQQEIKHKLKILKYAEKIGNVSEACREYNISRETYYKWLRKYQEKGAEGLISSKSRSTWLKRKITEEIEDQILYLRRNESLSQHKISLYLATYQNIKVSPSGVRKVFLRNGLNRLTAKQPKNVTE